MRRKLDRGSDGPPLMGTVDSAEVIDTTTLQARLRNDDTHWGPNNGVIFDVVQVMDKNGLHTVASTTSDGKELIKDGILVASGQPSPFTHHCGN